MKEVEQTSTLAIVLFRWILQETYLKDSHDAKTFLDEEKYEWYGCGVNEDGFIGFEAPRKWQKQRETTGRRALEGLRILVYGECIIPSLVMQPGFAPLLQIGFRFVLTSSSYDAGDDEAGH